MNKAEDKKILFFTNTLQGGGAETVEVQLIEYYLKQQYRCVIVSLYDPKINLSHPNLEIINLSFKMSRSGLSSAYKMAFLKIYLNNNNQWKYFIKKYSKQKFNLVKAALPLSHKAAMISPFADKTIYQMQVSFSIVPLWFRKTHNLIIQKYYKNKKISCVSKGIKNEILQDLNLENNDVAVIYNPAPSVSKLNKINKKIYMKSYMLVIGRLTKQKNISRAIDIFYEGKFFENYDLVILGQGPLQNKLENQIAHYALGNCVKLKGFVNDSLSWIKNAKLLLCTSKQEGMPIVLLEALSLGTPVVCSDCYTGPSEILTGELSDYLVPVKSDNSVFISKINDILDGNYPEISNVNLDNFQIETIAKQYLDFYRV